MQTRCLPFPGESSPVTETWRFAGLPGGQPGGLNRRVDIPIYSLDLLEILRRRQIDSIRYLDATSKAAQTVSSRHVYYNHFRSWRLLWRGWICRSRRGLEQDGPRSTLC